MKIIGNKESVNQISLTHKGINARFNYFPTVMILTHLILK